MRKEKFVEKNIKIITIWFFLFETYLDVSLQQQYVIHNYFAL